MNNTNRFHIASSLVLLAIFFSAHCACGQIPKLFLKFAEKQNKVQSGYVKWQMFRTWDEDTSAVIFHEGFFISTPKDLKYFVCREQDKYPNALIFDSKLNHTNLYFYISADTLDKEYDCWEVDAKDTSPFTYPTVNGVSIEAYENCLFQRISPKINKKNIRYIIRYPDQEEDMITDRSRELEFDRKTFSCFQEEFSETFGGINRISYKIDIFEQRLYDYIHPDILDTISCMFEELKKGYERQQAEKDSISLAHLCDSIAQSVANNGYTWAESIPQEVQQDTLFFMPEWKFPLLSGDTLYSDSINSRFLLIDMWFISCAPCRLTMRELSSIDTLYPESLLKIVSINALDKDTAKISKVVNSLNLKSDVVCAYRDKVIHDMSRKMGESECVGSYPQVYLIEMKTKQVIWHSCGWSAGFTKEIEKIITSGE